MFYSRELPNPLLRENGTPVRNAQEWETQKEYLRELAQEHMYGPWPHKANKIEGTCLCTASVFADKGIRENHQLHVVYDDLPFIMDVTVYRPNDDQKHPVIIANSFSNDEKFQNPYLPVLVERGYALASFLMGDIVPDVLNKITGLFGNKNKDSTGGSDDAE